MRHLEIYVLKNFPLGHNLGTNYFRHFRKVLQQIIRATDRDCVSHAYEM